MLSARGETLTSSRENDESNSSYQQKEKLTTSYHQGKRFIPARKKIHTSKEKIHTSKEKMVRESR